MVKDQVSGPLASQASKFLGESESSVGKALGGIFPAVLGKMINTSEDSSGLTKLFDMAKGADTSILDDVSGLFGGGAGNVAKLMNNGSGALNLLLGNNTGGLIDKIAEFSGLKGSAASSLIKMAAPFLMSMVGRQIKEKALDVIGFGKLLGSQKQHVKSAMPSGLMSKLGGSFLGKGFDAVTGFAGDGFDAGKKVVGNAAGTVGSVAGGAMNAGKKAIGGTADAVGNVAGGAMGAGKKVVGGAANLAGDVGGAAAKTGGSILKWLVPVFIALLALSFFGFRTGCSAVDDTVGSAKDLTENVAAGAADMAGDATKAVGDAAGSVADAAGNAADAAAGAIGSVFSTIDEAAKKSLDGIKFATGSAGAQMKEFIDGGFKGDSRFRFNNLTFNTGSAAIGGESGVEVDNLAAILKAYPAVKIHIDGYTDNTGNAAANVQLSNARATAVKARLISKGIDASRITAHGNGAADPVADNATEEGRAENRRIEVSIVQ